MSCPDCFKGTVHDHAEPKGYLENLYGYSTYVSMPTGTTNPKSTIIFFTDAFGLNLVNNKILADHYATETGCRVLTPDIIPGGAATVGTLHAMNSAMGPLGSWFELLNPITFLSRSYYFVIALSGMIPLMLRGAAPKAYPGNLKFARDVRAALPPGGKLGTAGFCWGGHPSTHLCAETDVEGGTKPLLDCAFSAHPSFVGPSDFPQALGRFNVPYSCAVAELDFAFSKSSAEQAEALLRQKFDDGVGNYKFVIHKGSHHGFAVRASAEIGSVGKDGYEAAAKQAVDFYNKHLK